MEPWFAALARPTAAVPSARRPTTTPWPGAPPEPASFPTRLVAGPTAGGITDALVEMGVEFFGELVARLVDRRWKVTVTRGRVNARAVTWRIVHAEFFVGREAAEERRTSLLDNWRPGAMADLPRMSFSDLRSLRLTTKG
jgi:hypothetical protein